MSKTPEEWLELAGEASKRGVFKLFLGYAPGVGKTYSMLSEAIRRHKRGEDVVIGIIETHGRAGIAELAQQLESVPRNSILYKGGMLEEMNVDAVIARRPLVVLVDELAHTNVEGSRHAKRYEDVMELLGEGINVISTVNIQHLESLRPVVQNITGIQVREVVPDWVIGRANEVVMADLTPEALETRMRRGDIYPVERAEQALTHFFRRGNLIALRELALEQVTRAVDRNLDDYLRRKGMVDSWRVAERIAVCISASPGAQYLIARGARLAERIGADFYVVHVDCPEDLAPKRSSCLEANLHLAENLRATVVRLKGSSFAPAIAAFAKEKRISQIILGRSGNRGARKYQYLLAVARFLNEAPMVDVHIITQPTHNGSTN